MLRFLVARQQLLYSFPWTEEVEVPEVLGQFHRLVDDPLQLVVVADLDVAGEREVLAQRMTLETIVGEYAPQIRMLTEPNAVEIIRLPFPPARGVEDAGDGRDRCLLTRPRFDADPTVVSEAEEIVDHLETFGPTGIVHAADVHKLLELAVYVVTQEGEDAHDRLATDADHEFVARNVDRLHLVRQRRLHILAKVAKR